MRPFPSCLSYTISPQAFHALLYTLHPSLYIWNGESLSNTLCSSSLFRNILLPPCSSKILFRLDKKLFGVSHHKKLFGVSHDKNFVGLVFQYKFFFKTFSCKVPQIKWTFLRGIAIARVRLFSVTGRYFISSTPNQRPPPPRGGGRSLRQFLLGGKIWKWRK